MPDKHEVGGSSPLGPTKHFVKEVQLTAKAGRQMFIENRISKSNEQIVVMRNQLILN